MPGVPKTTKQEVLTRFRDLFKTTTVTVPGSGGGGFSIGFGAGFSSSGSTSTSHQYRTFVVGTREAVIDGDDKSWCSIAMPGGAFVSQSLRGGGSVVVPYRPNIVVELHDRSYVDRRGRKEHHFLDDGGLFHIEQEILKTMTNSCLPHSDGVTDLGILSEPILPATDDVESMQWQEDGGRRGAYQSQAVLRIEFSCEFHWDLS